VLKEYSSLKMRKAWRRLTGRQPATGTLATCGSGDGSKAVSVDA
jgi:hypothetical protein